MLPERPSMIPDGAGSTYEFRGCTGEVRKLLFQISSALASFGIGNSEFLANIQLVMAEVLNNIEEHSYRMVFGQPILVSVHIENDQIVIETEDSGHPMPESSIPEKLRPNADVACAELPEGGFGWYLIHSLAPNPTYQRDGSKNLLRLTFSQDGEAAIAASSADFVANGRADLSTASRKIAKSTGEQDAGSSVSK